jgi:hypothetical protein
MKHARLALGIAFALTSGWALAQKAPESLLPPGFDEPPPAPAPAPSAPRAPAAPTASGPSATQPVGPITLPAPGAPPRPEALSAANLPSLEELEKMEPGELEEALGIKPKFDIPPAARRSMERVGVIDDAEGGMPSGALAGQNASLVKAALAGHKGMMVSRWGHILLRRALASRLDAPYPMNPADFAAMRAALLLRMGEADAARAVVQDVDTGNFTPSLTNAAFDAYVATADFTGICPALVIHGGLRRDPQWQLASSICAAFRGDGSSALSELDRALSRGSMPKVDILLAQKYAGAAGKARRAVKIEWDDVSDMNPWRYGLAIAVGLEPPAGIMRGAGVRYDYVAATAPMLALPSRAAAADHAGGAGILSSAAMVDLYSQIYADNDIGGDWADRAEALRNSYVADAPADRLAAIRSLWDGTPGSAERYSRQVLTAYAAARLAPTPDFSAEAPDLIASMLTAGLDRNAMRWSSVADAGSQGWALLVLAAPDAAQTVDSGALGSYYDDDSSEDSRKTAFLVAGLAGLGRISPSTADDYASRIGVDLRGETRWTKLIDRAAIVKNPVLVALLAGVGMQGDSWDKMTPRYLFHIVSALRQVGLEPEARMIAAEAVARG